MPGRCVLLAIADTGCGMRLGEFHSVQTPLNALKPPSTGMTVPVTNPLAPSLSNHKRVPIRSLGLPNRAMGVWDWMVLPRGVSIRPRW